MAHAAKINNDGIVEQVIVIPNLPDESDASVEAYCNSIGLPGTWVRTSYNAAENGFRQKYSGIGDRFVEDATRPDGGYFESPVSAEVPAE